MTTIISIQIKQQNKNKTQRIIAVRCASIVYSVVLQMQTTTECDNYDPTTIITSEKYLSLVLRHGSDHLLETTANLLKACYRRLVEDDTIPAHPGVFS